MGAILSGIGSLLSRTSERMDTEKAERQKQKEAEKKTKLEGLKNILDADQRLMIQSGVGFLTDQQREFLNLQQAETAGIKAPDVEKTLALDSIQSDIAQPPPPVFPSQAPEYQPPPAPLVPSPEQVQQAAAAPVQPGARGADEALLPEPIFQQGQAATTIEPQIGMIEGIGGGGLLAQPAIPPVPPVPPTPMDPAIEEQMETDVAYQQAADVADNLAESLAPVPDQITVSDQDPITEAFAERPGQMFLTSEQRLRRQLINERMSAQAKKEGELTAALNIAPAEQEAARQAIAQTIEDYEDQMRQINPDYEISEEELQVFHKLRNSVSDPNVLFASENVSGSALLQSGITELDFGGGKLQVSGDRTYKVARTTKGELFGIPTQEASPYLEILKGTSGRSDVAIGIMADGESKVLWTGAPKIPTSGKVSTTINPLAAAWAVSSGLPISKIPQELAIPMQLAAIEQGIPLYSDKVNEQKSRLDTADDAMNVAFDAAARIQGFKGGMAEMLEQTEGTLPEGTREMFIRSLTNIKERGKGGLARLISTADAITITSMRGALETLIPKGFGDAGNVAIVERERSLQVALSNWGESVPSLVAKFKAWKSLKSNIDGQVRKDTLRRQNEALIGLRAAGLIGADGQSTQVERELVVNDETGEEFWWDGEAMTPVGQE